MQPQEPIISDPESPYVPPSQEIINDPDLPPQTPVDDVDDPGPDGPAIVD
jgi:hypothetical protein